MLKDANNTGVDSKPTKVNTATAIDSLIIILPKKSDGAKVTSRKTTEIQTKIIKEN